MNSIFAVLLVLTCVSALPFSSVKHMKIELGPNNDPPSPFQQAKNSSNESTESDGEPQVDGRIINGAPATLGQFPWQAYIAMGGNKFCGGSIISNQWILTAAHCAATYSSFLICVGLTSLSYYQTGEQCTYATKKIVNSGYNSNTIANDIALLKVRTLTFSSTVSAVQLPKLSDTSKSFYGQSAIVTGFGITETGSNSVTLQYAKVTVISNSECSSYYNSRTPITSTNICTSVANSKGTCSGDSGGALVYKEGSKYTQIGIVSFGAETGCLNAPDAYARVTSYLNWISQNTGIALRS